MPKIIEHARQRLMEEAKRQISLHGYREVTVRSVAAACGVGVGTVYNYFPSKEMLVAAVVLEDWKRYLNEMASLSIDSPENLFRGIYDSLRRFVKENETLFSDTDAAKLAAAGFSARHKLLREQIASFIAPLCTARGMDNAVFTAEFLAEALINWSAEGADFDTLYPIIKKIMQK